MSRIDAPPLLPYDLSVWYPLLFGPLACDGVLRVERAFRPPQPAWFGLPTGGSRVLVHGQPAANGALALRSLLHRDPVRRELRRLPDGYSAERFHVLPGTGGGTVLLPAAGGRACRAGLELLPAGRARWRAAKRVLRAARSVGWSTPPGAASLAVLRRAAHDEAPHHDCATELATPHALRGTLAGVASGVPGPTRKVTLLIAPTRGLPARFVKISRGHASTLQVRREIEALATIADRFPARGLAPRLIDDGECGDSAYFVQEALDGARSADALGIEHVEFLGRLARETLAHAPLATIPRFGRDVHSLHELEATSDAEWCSAVGALRRSIEAFFGDASVPFGFAHGDFTPWNLKVRQGRLRAFDWESFHEGAPALHDLFHFVVQTGILVQRASAEQILGEVRGLLDGIAAPLAADAFRRPEHALGALALYVLHVAIADELAHRIERPPFEQVDWLRGTRLDLARLLTSELDARCARATEHPASPGKRAA